MFHMAKPVYVNARRSTFGLSCQSAAKPPRRAQPQLVSFRVMHPDYYDQRCVVSPNQVLTHAVRAKGSA